MYALGFVLSLALAAARRRRYGVDLGDVLALGAAGMLGVVAGGRLFYYLTVDPAAFSTALRGEDPLWRGRFVLYGGLFAATLGVALVAWTRRLPVLRAVDLFAPAVGLAVAVGRVGCFLSGCCYGRPSETPWAVRYLQGPAAGLGRLHPTQLYEAAAGALLMALLLAAERRRPAEGRLFLLALAGYAASRAILEPFRGDERGAVIALGGLSTSQVLSLAVLAATAAAWPALGRRRPEARPPAPRASGGAPGARLLASGAAALAIVVLLLALSVRHGAVARDAVVERYVRDGDGVRLLGPP